MKIVVCLVTHPWRNHKYDNMGEAYFAEPLRKLGHEALMFNMDDYLSGPGLPSRPDDGALVRFVREVKPGWVLMNDYTNDTFTENTWKAIAEICPTTDWFGDDQQRFDDYSSLKARWFTHPVTCDYFSYPRYLEKGINGIIQSGWGAIDYSEVKEEETDAAAYDVTHVGVYSHYRDFLKQLLISRGIKVKFYGPGWEGGRLSTGQMKNVFRTSKISLSLQKIAVSYDIRYLLRHPTRLAALARNSFRGTKLYRKQINARYFEINACGGFQLAEYVPMIEEFYDIGREITVFSSPEEMADLVSYYLAAGDKRLSIARKGAEKALTSHLMMHRLGKIHEQIFKSR